MVIVLPVVEFYGIDGRIGAVCIKICFPFIKSLVHLFGIVQVFQLRKVIDVDIVFQKR